MLTDISLIVWKQCNLAFAKLFLCFKTVQFINLASPPIIIEQIFNLNQWKLLEASYFLLRSTNKPEHRTMILVPWAYASWSSSTSIVHLWCGKSWLLTSLHLETPKSLLNQILDMGAFPKMSSKQRGKDPCWFWVTPWRKEQWREKLAALESLLWVSFVASVTMDIKFKDLQAFNVDSLSNFPVRCANSAL